MKTTVGIAGHSVSQVVQKQEIPCLSLLCAAYTKDFLVFFAEAKVFGKCIPSQSMSLSLPKLQYFQQWSNK